LKVETLDGTSLAGGKTVRVTATVWAWSTFTADSLDLYYAADANSPVWTLITTLTPTAAGAQTSAPPTPPPGALQVRAQFRYQSRRRPHLHLQRPGRPRVRRRKHAPVTVFEDDFETDKGWTVNPNATDTATTGRWERHPSDELFRGEAARHHGHGQRPVTDAWRERGGRERRGRRGDVDTLPAVTLPASGASVVVQLLRPPTNSSADFFRVVVVGPSSATTVFQELGTAANDDAAWVTRTVNINAFAGQTVRIRIEAADASGGSLVEAGVDTVLITRQQ
jgi:hypothetical protein